MSKILQYSLKFFIIFSSGQKYSNRWIPCPLYSPRIRLANLYSTDSSCHQHQISSGTRGPHVNKPGLSNRALTSHAGDIRNKNFSKRRIFEFHVRWRSQISNFKSYLECSINPIGIPSITLLRWWLIRRSVAAKSGLGGKIRILKFCVVIFNFPEDYSVIFFRLLPSLWFSYMINKINKDKQNEFLNNNLKSKTRVMERDGTLETFV